MILVLLFLCLATSSFIRLFHPTTELMRSSVALFLFLLSLPPEIWLNGLIHLGHTKMIFPTLYNFVSSLSIWKFVIAYDFSSKKFAFCPCHFSSDNFASTSNVTVFTVQLWMPMTSGTSFQKIVLNNCMLVLSSVNVSESRFPTKKRATDGDYHVVHFNKGNLDTDPP